MQFHSPTVLLLDWDGVAIGFGVLAGLRWVEERRIGSYVWVA